MNYDKNADLAFDDSAYKNVVAVSSFWNKFSAIENTDEITEDYWIQKASVLTEISAQNNVALFLYNTFTQRFIYMGDQMKVLGGYDPTLYTSESGISFTFSRFSPHQLPGVLKSNKIIFEYFIKHKVTFSGKVLINSDFLYQHKNGKYFQFLQQFIVVKTDSSGLPLLVMSFGHDISHIKKEDSRSIVITSPWGGNEFYSYNTDQNDYESIKPFSEQETKVLLLLAQGLNTRKIADKLFISPHTVDTHRRSLIKKTNCIDTTSVVTYARMINLI